MEQVKNITLSSHAQGFGDALRKASGNPDLAKEILSKMEPKMRDQVIKSFNKGWLARWFGG